MKTDLLNFTLHLADTHLILGQRLGEWCGHNFVLEQDIAMSNIALDLFGQSRSLYQYAAELQGEGKTEDDLAFLRGERQYKNLLLVEQKNGDFAHTLTRQFFYDVFHLLQCEELLKSSDERLRAIAEKSVKEVRYHLTWSSVWVIRLGDGTSESHARMQKAADSLWMWTGEMCTNAPYEEALIKARIAPDNTKFKAQWTAKVQEIFNEATLKVPMTDNQQSGGKSGVHSENLGFILAEMQILQRTYPGLSW
jgi:ring-1,2-phenylacetyl-CoA epoxidase subunit PaaC